MLNEPPTNEYTPKAHQQLSTNPSSIPTISHTMPVPTHALQPYACVLESARPPQYRNALHTPSRQRRNTSKVHALSSKFPDNDPVDNPDFDDLVLDDEYYKEMGMTQADIEAQMAFKASDVDPLGEDVTLDSLFKTRKGLPRHLMDQSAAAEEPGWGPDVVLVAGFRAEEIAMIRVVLDSAGADAVKLVVAGNDTLYMPAEAALHLPEPDWEQPRQLSDIGYGGGWGSQRTILFSGLSLKAQATLIELLEDSGLPPVCATAITADTAHEPVGALLAEAVKEQRERRNAPEKDWESDMEERTTPLTPVEQLLAQQTTERLKELSDDMEGGSIDHWFDREDQDEDTPGGFTVSLEDVLAAKEMKKKQQQQQQNRGDGQVGATEETQTAMQKHPQKPPSSVVDNVIVQTIPPVDDGTAAHTNGGHAHTNGVHSSTNGHSNGASHSNGTSHITRNGNKNGHQPAATLDNSSSLNTKAGDNSISDDSSSLVIEADAAELEDTRSNSPVSDATAAPPLDVESTTIPHEEEEEDVSRTQGQQQEEDVSKTQGQQEEKGQPLAWSSTYSEVNPEEAERLWAQYKVVDENDSSVKADLAAAAGLQGVHIISRSADENNMEENDVEDNDDMEDNDDVEENDVKENEREENDVLLSSSRAHNGQPSNVPPSAAAAVKPPKAPPTPPPPASSLDQEVQKKGEDAEAWLLDTIAGGEAASFDEMTDKLSDMGEAARQRGAAMQARMANEEEEEEEEATTSGVSLKESDGGVTKDDDKEEDDRDEDDMQGRQGLSNTYAASQPGAKDPFDFGFRKDTTFDGVPEHPLEAFRDATWRALDAGISPEALMSVMEEAIRGGSPVMRYRAWDPSGAHVDDAPPPVMQSSGNNMTKQQLKEVAERNGLNYERLLEDAQRKGVLLND